MRFPFPQTVALVLFTHLSMISCQQFDTVPGCIPPGRKIVLTKTLSCPCYLGYSLYSPIDTNLTTDFLLLPTQEYHLWQRNLTKSPSVIHQHSIMNASTTTTIFKTPTEIGSGSFTFVIRTHTNKTDCSARLLYHFTQIARCTDTRGNKIIGGAPIPALSNHMAILESETGLCSGTLITNRHILTAAHCNLHGGNARIGNRTSQAYKIGSFKTHPSYNPTPGLPKFDLAVVTLSNPINDTYPQPVRYARGGKIRGDVTITGFGQTHERLPGTAFRELRGVKVGVLNSSECGKRFTENGFGGVAKTLRVGMGLLCLGGECGDSCYGDSGGGALVESDGGFVVVGVVSAGIGCGREGLPGIYTSVMEFADWVEGIVGEMGVLVGVEMRSGGDVGGGAGWIGVGVVLGLIVVLGILESVKFGWERIGDLGLFEEDDEDDKILENVERRWFRSREVMSDSDVMEEDCE